MTDLDRLEELNIAGALKAVDYKYFGDYPLSEDQWDAVWTMHSAAKALPSLVTELRQLREIVREAGPMLSEGARLMGTHSAWAEEARTLHNKIKEVMG